MASVKEESPAGTGISDVPVFTAPRESATSTPASTFTNASLQLKPERDESFVPPSAAAATSATAALLSDVIPATPRSLSEESSPQLPEEPVYRVKTPAKQNSSSSNIDQTNQPLARRLVDQSSGLAAAVISSATRPRTPGILANGISAAGESCTNGEMSTELPGTPRTFTYSSGGLNEAATSKEAAYVSPTADPIEAEGLKARTTRATTRNSIAKNASPPGTISSPTHSHTSSTRNPSHSQTPVLTAMRAPRPQRTPRQIGKRAGPGEDERAVSQAPKLMSQLVEKDKASAKPPPEKRATRHSGLAATVTTSPVYTRTILGKRSRRESENTRASLSRELQRLRDTKEFAHIDEQPVVYTVWSNGKYVPANAAGEPIEQKKVTVKASKKSETVTDKKHAHTHHDQPPHKKMKMLDGQPAAKEEAQEDPQSAVQSPIRRRVKKWLAKGLYAGQPTPNNPAIGLTSVERKALAKIPQFSKKGPPNKILPLPIFNGMRILIQGRDFKMPYDVFNPLPPGQPKPIKYGRFSKNRFVGDAHAIWRKNPHYDDFQSKCVCKPETGCDEDCQNRIMLYECNDMNCNVGAEKCHNREFQRLAERTASKSPYHIGVEVYKTRDRGHGIRASRSFEPGQIIMEYIGEIITEEESDRRMNELYKDNECYYLMSFDQSLIIDGTSGSIARFVNHSCSPNCRMIKWIVSGQPRIALFAGDRPIMTGEELTYDYNFDPYSSKNVQICLCGSENCRGVLGPRKSEKALSKSAAERAKAELDKGKHAKKATFASGKQPKSKMGKRKLGVYDTTETEAHASGHPAKRARISQSTTNGPGRPRKEKSAPSRGKLSAAKVTTTKAALAVLAAKAAQQSKSSKKTAKGSKSVTSKTTKPAKPANQAKHKRVAKTVKGVKPIKIDRTLKAIKASAASKKQAKETLSTKNSLNGSKTKKSVKPTGTLTKTKSPKAQTVKSSKVTRTLKVTKSTKVVVKSTKAAAKGKDRSSGKFLASATRVRKSTKVSVQRKKSTGNNSGSTPTLDHHSDSESLTQVTPMAKAVAKAAKEAAEVAKSTSAATKNQAHKGQKKLQHVSAKRTKAVNVSKTNKEPTAPEKGDSKSEPAKWTSKTAAKPASKAATKNPGKGAPMNGAKKSADQLAGDGRQRAHKTHVAINSPTRKITKGANIRPSSSAQQRPDSSATQPLRRKPGRPPLNLARSVGTDIGKTTVASARQIEVESSTTDVKSSSGRLGLVTRAETGDKENRQRASNKRWHKTDKALVAESAKDVIHVAPSVFVVA